MPESAQEFVQHLKRHEAEAERRKIARYFEPDEEDRRVIGVRMKTIFDLAKQSKAMPLEEIDRLLDQPYYEARMGAAAIMDFRARGRTPEEKRRALYELYLRRHDRLDNWDFVDRAAKRVIGGYLHDFDGPRDILHELAGSDDVWERRTAIVATSCFIGKGDLDDTYRIAERLLEDEHEMIRKAVGSWLREAGKRDEDRLLRFLEKHAARMPRITLRYAMEKLTPARRESFRSLGASG